MKASVLIRLIREKMGEDDPEIIAIGLFGMGKIDEVLNQDDYDNETLFGYPLPDKFIGIEVVP